MVSIPSKALSELISKNNDSSEDGKINTNLLWCSKISFKYIRNLNGLITIDYREVSQVYSF